MSYDPEQITFFAKTDARGQHMPFGIKAKDRTRHVYCIGKTGMGKSTLLENMAIQDIKNGNGLAFIDPHGQTAETLLNYVPEERKNDVLYFAPFDTDYPVSFNVMEDVGPDKRHLVVSGLMSVFEKIWVDAWSARMAYILQNTLMALLEYPDSTLLGVNRMLSDKVYRQRVVENIKDPSVRSFWVDEFAKYNERYMQEAGDAIKNKIGQFTSNPLIRNIIGQPKSSFDIRKIMDEKKILIMNLSKGLVGESNANLLGSMLTTRIYLAAMSRADLSQEEMRTKPNFYFFVDEFQSFANATFADILSEARKYKLNLTIAHQYIEQMEEEVRNAVFGNVGTIIAFRVGPFDAEILETIFTPKFLAPDIVNLGFAQVYLTLMIDGIGSQPFSAVTLPPIDPPATSIKKELVESSRRQFARPRAAVEEAIFKWHEPLESPSGGQRNNSSGNNSRQQQGRPSNSNNHNNHNNQNSYNQKQNTHNNNSPESGERKGAGNSEERSTQERRTSKPRSSETPEAAQHERKKPEEKRSSKQNGQKNEKSLEDLRAILRNISQDQDKNDAVKEHKSEQKKKQKDTQKPAPPAQEGTTLKDMLASAIQKEVASEPPQKPPVQEVPTQKAPEPPPSPQATPSSKKDADDPLSPKKLERMMRVHGNERSPLK